MGLFRKRATVDDMKLMCDVLYDAMPFVEPEVVSFAEAGLTIRLRLLPSVYAVFVYGDRQWHARDVVVDASGEPVPLGGPLPVTSQGAKPVDAAKEMGGYVMERLRMVLNSEDSEDTDRQYAQNAFSQLAWRMERGSPRY